MELLAIGQPADPANQCQARCNNNWCAGIDVNLKHAASLLMHFSFIFLS